MCLKISIDYIGTCRESDPASNTPTWDLRESVWAETFQRMFLVCGINDLFPIALFGRCGRLLQVHHPGPTQDAGALRSGCGVPV